MNARSTLIASALLAASLISGTVNAATITQLSSQSDYFGSYEVINFDQYANGIAYASNLYSSLGVTFTNNWGAVPIFEWTSLENYQTGENFRITTSPKNVIGTVSSYGGGFSNFLDVSFENGVYEVGAFFGNDQGSIFSKQTLTIFGANNVLLGSVDVSANDNTSVDQFIGTRSDSLIYRARFENDATNSLSVVLDDVTFTTAVPEASTYGMMLAGLGLVGLMARRRNQTEV